jgi:flagellar biosynthetic protein FliR
MIMQMPEITAWVGSFFWPFIRVAALFGILPVLGGPQVPKRIRLGLAVLTTFAMMPLIGDVPAIDPLSGPGVLLVFQQFIIGFLMGFMVLMVFNAIVLAGESVAITMGLGFAQMSDPMHGVQIPIIGQFYQIMAVLLFLAVNGHHAVLQLMAESFTSLPIGTLFEVDLIWKLIAWSKILFVGSLKVALPAIVAMLTVNLIMGIMTRASPQLNVFSVGFPITMTVGFVIITATLPMFFTNFEFLLVDTYTTMGAIIRGTP